jgi:hypothetical protein
MLRLAPLRECLIAVCATALLGVSSIAFAVPITDPAQLLPNATLIDFESIPTGGNLLTSVPNPLVIGEVTFSSVTAQISVFNITVSGWAADGTEVSGNTLFPGGEPDSAIAIDFATPVAQFLFGWGDPNFSGNMVLAFSSQGTLLESASVALGPPGGGHAAWIGISRNHNDIARILVQPDQSMAFGDDYAFDNLYYAHTVPEPSSLLMLGIGLIVFKGGGHVARTLRRRTPGVRPDMR